MNKLRSKIVVAALFVALGLVGALMNSQQAIAQGPVTGVPVSIVQPVPVPVTGTVGISGIPTMRLAPESNVGIAGNSEANALWIRDSDNPARHPFTLAQQQVSAGGGPGIEIGLGTVPSGQRYVIEHYEVDCNLNPGTTLTDVNVNLVNGRNGFISDHVAPHIILPYTAAPSVWGGNGNVRLYAEPGALIGVGAIANSDGIQTCGASVSGYVVSLP